MFDENFYKNLKTLANITNFGLSMVSPLIICLFTATWLKNKFELGNYVMLIAIILGIGGGIANFYDLYKKSEKISKE